MIPPPPPPRPPPQRGSTREYKLKKARQRIRTKIHGKEEKVSVLPAVSAVVQELDTRTHRSPLKPKVQQKRLTKRADHEPSSPDVPQKEQVERRAPKKEQLELQLQHPMREKRITRAHKAHKKRNTSAHHGPATPDNPQKTQLERLLLQQPTNGDPDGWTICTFPEDSSRFDEQSTVVTDPAGAYEPTKNEEILVLIPSDIFV